MAKPNFQYRNIDLSIKVYVYIHKNLRHPSTYVTTYHNHETLKKIAS